MPAGLLGLLVLLKTATASPLRVAVTIYPLQLVAEQVGGDRLEVQTLLPPGASPHTFEPRPADVARLVQASLFVRVGGLEDWTERLLAAAPRPIPVLTLLELEGLHPLDEPAGGGAHEHEHGERDPHFWTDPIRVRDAVVPALVSAFSELDPAGAGVYRQRGEAEQERLTQLDAEIRRILAGRQSAGFISFHNSWSYFAQRYDLRQVAVVEQAPDQEPTARSLARLIDRAREARVQAILVEPQQNPRMARTIAAEFGGRLVRVDPLGDPADPQRSSYAALMLFNARAFAEALDGGSGR